ncbi:hypothetical protein GCWU000342_00341 [Shuttleworthella satelles DSM 14600]|uniref:Uncharacterized protein n=1 Tax=Shuttleworthella satelles DSM 14600 TaxID=626523 RepID=C4G8P5_9FIRM|nr:hypothetical protein GCWU000342_00341 [Shuttleworthia satelles DSM 14600]
MIGIVISARTCFFFNLSMASSIPSSGPGEILSYWSLMIAADLSPFLNR